MKVVGRLLLATLVSCCLPRGAAQDVHSMSLGQIQIRLVSKAVSETNSLLKILLSTTAHFLDASFLEVDQVAFRKVACSILDYRLGSIKRPGAAMGSGTFYEANVTLTGYAYFVGDTAISQHDLINLSIDAFEAENSMFLRSLLGSTNAFLSNLEHAVVRVNGDKVVEQKGTSGTDASPSIFDNLPFPMWVVAVIAGGLAFLLVLCVALSCFCCCSRSVPVHEIHKKSSSGTNTKQTGANSFSDDDNLMMMMDARSKTPSPTRSITSQDSSVFTYNPKTSRTVASYFSTSNFSYDCAVDDAESSAQFYHQGGPGTILAPSKDLSLIEEGSEVSSEQSTPRQLRQQLEQQNFKSLLKRPESFEDDDDVGEFHSLTADALREIEWNAAQDGGATANRNRWDEAATRETTTKFDSGFDVYGDSSYGSPLKQQQNQGDLLETVDFASTDLETQMENLYGEKF